MSNKKFRIYTDGGARGNPGPAGIGVVIYDDNDEIVSKKSEYIGIKTNNQAEYQALILGIEEAINLGVDHLICHLDSELIVKQMKGEYKVKNKNIIDLNKIAVNLIKNISKVDFIHIRRENNTVADSLVNQATDRALG